MGAFAESCDLLQKVLHIVGQPRETTSARAIIREGVVGPQKTEHLRQMRFTAAEEPTHPSRRLLGLALVADVGVENAHEAALIFTFADEVLELEAQRSPLAVGHGVGHGCDAVV